MQTVIFMGIQATGKSTFYKDRFYRTHVRLNLDMLKTRHREKVLFSACLEAQQPCVIDNTNPEKVDRKRYIAPAKRTGFEVVGYYFQSKVAEAIERNNLRPEDERVPEKGIRSCFNRLELPTYDEGFDHLYYVRLSDNQFLVDEWLDEV